MSDSITDAALIGLRARERDLELDAVAVKARIEEVRELIAKLEHPRRRAKRRESDIIEMPLRVSGGIAASEDDDPEVA